MKILFINAFLNKDYDTLESKLILVLIMWFIVLIAIIIDLIAGVRKAIQLDEARTSQGFKRTVTKLMQYYGLLSFALMFDILASIVEPLPYITALASIFLVFIEAKSVYEKAEEKERRRLSKELDTLVILMENKDNIIKAASEIIKNENNKKNETNN